MVHGKVRLLKVAFKKSWINHLGNWANRKSSQKKKGQKSHLRINQCHPQVNGSKEPEAVLKQNFWMALSQGKKKKKRQKGSHTSGLRDEVPLACPALILNVWKWFLCFCQDCLSWTSLDKAGTNPNLFYKPTLALRPSWSVCSANLFPQRKRAWRQMIPRSSFGFKVL